MLNSVASRSRAFVVSRSTYCSLRLYSFPQSARFEMARAIAENAPWLLARKVHELGIEDTRELARITARVSSAAVHANICNFGALSNDQILRLAEIAIQKDFLYAKEMPFKEKLTSEQVASLQQARLDLRLVEAKRDIQEAQSPHKIDLTKYDLDPDRAWEAVQELANAMTAAQGFRYKWSDYQLTKERKEVLARIISGKMTDTDSLPQCERFCKRLGVSVEESVCIRANMDLNRLTDVKDFQVQSYNLPLAYRLEMAKKVLKRAEHLDQFDFDAYGFDLESRKQLIAFCATARPDLVEGLIRIIEKLGDDLSLYQADRNTAEEARFDAAKKKIYNSADLSSFSIQSFELIEEKHRYEIASIATKKDPNHVKSIKEYALEETSRIALAELLVKKGFAAKVAEHVVEFEIREERDRFALAEACVKKDPRGVWDFILRFAITTESRCKALDVTMGEMRSRAEIEGKAPLLALPLSSREAPQIASPAPTEEAEKKMTARLRALQRLKNLTPERQKEVEKEIAELQRKLS